MPVCPACGNSESLADDFTVTAHESAQHFVLAEGDHARHDKLELHIRSLWGSPTCKLVECSRCQMRFAWPFVSGDAEFYNLAFPVHNYPKEKWEFSKTLEVISKHNAKGRKLLEVGSGSGNFLTKVSPRYIEQEGVVATEFNDVSADSVRRKGFSVFQRDIRSSDFDQFEAKFDYIAMFQVLEHMDSIDEVAKRLKFLSHDGSHLFIAVPNVHLTEFNEGHGSLLDMPPNHIGGWSKKAFQAFGEQAGFRVEDFQVEPMSWAKFAKMDLVYSYLRRAQKPGTLDNRIRSKRGTRRQKLSEASFVLLTSPRRFKTWIKAGTSKTSLGGSAWVHLYRA